MIVTKLVNAGLKVCVKEELGDNLPREGGIAAILGLLDFLIDPDKSVDSWPLLVALDRNPQRQRKKLLDQSDAEFLQQNTQGQAARPQRSFPVFQRSHSESHYGEDGLLVSLHEDSILHPARFETIPPH